MANYAGKGTELWFTVGASTYSLGQITSMDGPTLEMATRDVTHLMSGAKEKATSMYDAGQITGEVIYDPKLDSHKFWMADVTAGTTGRATKLVMATTIHFWSGTGIPIKLTPKGYTPEGTVMADFAMVLTGTITTPTTV